MTKGKYSQNGITVNVEYDGEYPNLCSGILRVSINGKRWIFPRFCLVSGGSVWFDEGWSEHVELGRWDIDRYPKDFPDRYKDAVLNAVNNIVPYGCCGGCI